jgi:hypothetical protein
MRATVVLDLLGLLPRLELVLLVQLIPQHVVQLLVVFGLAHQPRTLLRTDVPLHLVLLFLLTEGDAVGDQFELVLELMTLLAQLAETDGLQFVGQEQLTVGGILHVETVAQMVDVHRIVIFIIDSGSKSCAI